MRWGIGKPSAGGGEENHLTDQDGPGFVIPTESAPATANVGGGRHLAVCRVLGRGGRWFERLACFEFATGCFRNTITDTFDRGSDITRKRDYGATDG